MNEKDLETVIKRSTVEFPRALTLTRTEKLLDTMGYVLQVNILYDVGYRITLREMSSVSISGVIKFDTFFGVKGASGSFKSYPYDKPRGDKIKGFKFVTIPGYTLSEHRKEVVALWDKVNEFVKDNLSH